MDKDIIQRFKDEMALWGHDISHLSDEEIVEGILAIQKLGAATQISFTEACKAFVYIINYVPEV